MLLDANTMVMGVAVRGRGLRGLRGAGDMGCHLQKFPSWVLWHRAHFPVSMLRKLLYKVYLGKGSGGRWRGEPFWETHAKYA